MHLKAWIIIMYILPHGQHCAPVSQNNLPLLQWQAFREVSYSEYQIISKPWAWKPPCWMCWQNIDKGNLLQPSSASTRESENCWPGLWLPLIICCIFRYPKVCYHDAAHSLDQRPPSGSQCRVVFIRISYQQGYLIQFSLNWPHWADAGI